ncbi:MAG: carbohydrate ABC transporter permease [Bacillota bacterium]
MKDVYTKWLVIVLVILWTVTPLYWFLSMAFKTPAEISSFPPSFYPKHPTIMGLITVLGRQYVSRTGEVFLPSGQSGQVVRGLLNSFILAAVVTVITMVLVVPLGYTFGRLEFPHKNKLLFALLFCVAVPPIVTLIPFFALFMKLRLTGTLLGLVIVTLTITVPFVTWLLSGFFRNVPYVERLARTDGFSRFETLVMIVIPMARVGIMVGAIVAFLFSWNEYAFAQILVNGTSATTLPASISGFLFQHPEPEHLSAAVLYSMVPPFAVAYLLQRHITKMNIVEPMGR